MPRMLVLTALMIFGGALNCLVAMPRVRMDSPTFNTMGGSRHELSLNATYESSGEQDSDHETADELPHTQTKPAFAAIVKSAV